MASKHARHHGISFVLSIVLSTVLSEILRRHLPGLFNVVEAFAAAISDVFQLPAERHVIAIAAVAFVIAVIYGHLRGVAERRRESRNPTGGVV